LKISLAAYLFEPAKKAGAFPQHWIFLMILYPKTGSWKGQMNCKRPTRLSFQLLRSSPFWWVL